MWRVICFDAFELSCAGLFWREWSHVWAKILSWKNWIVGEVSLSILRHPHMCHQKMGRMWSGHQSHGNPEIKTQNSKTATTRLTTQRTPFSCALELATAGVASLCLVPCAEKTAANLLWVLFVTLRLQQQQLPTVLPLRLQCCISHEKILAQRTRWRPPSFQATCMGVPLGMYPKQDAAWVRKILQSDWIRAAAHSTQYGRMRRGKTFMSSACFLKV